MIRLEHISKQFSNNIVLDDISLSIPEGEIYGLVGKNGVGKTTLLNIMAGISNPTLGKRWIDDQPIDSLALEKGLIGYLPDLPGFYDMLTVREYLTFLEDGIRANRISQTKELIEKFDLNEDEQIKKLSRGSRQKLGIASAIIGSPKILLLDEPTSALDPIGRKDTMNLIRGLKKSGLTIMLSTHILSDLEMVCDRVGFLHKGKIVEEVDLHSVDTAKTSYEITLDTNEIVDSNMIRNIFREQMYSFEKNKLIITLNNDSKDAQAKLFYSLSRIPYKIEHIELKRNYDLEQVMESVLTR